DRNVVRLQFGGRSAKIYVLPPLVAQAPSDRATPKEDIECGGKLKRSGRHRTPGSHPSPLRNATGNLLGNNGKTSPVRQTHRCPQTFDSCDPRRQPKLPVQKPRGCHSAVVRSYFPRSCPLPFATVNVFWDFSGESYLNFS